MGICRICQIQETRDKFARGTGGEFCRISGVICTGLRAGAQVNLGQVRDGSSGIVKRGICAIGQ